MSETYYDEKIEKMKQEHSDLYYEVINELYGRDISSSSFKNLTRREKTKITYTLKNKITIRESKYDINKLTHAIQGSRSGIGGCAMTMFRCGLCGKEELWSNTSTPKVCKECANEMATNIVLKKYNIEKD